MIQGIPGAQSGDSLDDLFSDAGDSDDLSGLFGEEPAEGAEASSDDDLGDLFAEEETGDDLDSLFDDSEDIEAPQQAPVVAAPVAAEDDADLSVLFGEDDAAEPVSGVEVSEPKEEAAEPQDTQEVKEEPVVAPVRRRPPPVLGQLSRPTRTLELKGKPVVARSAAKKQEEPKDVTKEPQSIEKDEAQEEERLVPEINALPETAAPSVEESAEVQPANVSQAVAEEEPTEEAPVKEEESQPEISLASLSSAELKEEEMNEDLTTQSVSFAVPDATASVVPSASEADDSLADLLDESESGAPSDDTSENSGLTSLVGADEAAPTQSAVTIPDPRGEAFRRERMEAESTRLSVEAEKRLLLQAEIDRQARRFEDAERLWGYVNRIMGLLAADNSVQQVINSFELSRNQEIDQVQFRRLMDALTPIMSSHNVNTGSPGDTGFVMEMLYDEVLGISVLGPLWRDDKVTEILVDSWDSISVEAGGLLMPTRLRFRDSEHAESVARALAERISDRAVSKSNPLVTAELPRARVQFAYGPVVRGGLSLTIRKFQPLLTFEKLLEFGSLDLRMARFLETCVRAKANILVSGGTGTGKTTIINLLSGFIPDTERVVTIEDAFELELRNRHWVPLQTKEKASADDEVSVTLADLLTSTLRMRPDRIIVGEIRESGAAEVMIQAANTGHEGTMTTIHANSGFKAVNERLAVLLRQGQGATDEIARQTIASAFQLVVQVSRSRGKRYISEISVVDATHIENGSIQPEAIFRGHVDSDGNISFIRDKSLRSDTDLYGKLVDAGLDTSEWENN